MADNTIHIWTDGSCINNGKSGAICGIGIYYSMSSCNNVSTQLPEGRNTNNRAELCAILYALCTNNGSTSIIIYTDSEYSINCITKYNAKWKTTGWKTAAGKPVEWADIIRYICTVIDSRIEKGGSTQFVHVKGHSGDINNNAADILARNAALTGTQSNIISFLYKRCKVPFI